jgi:pimeloyl-ACP methyl ester carboxylesterase
MELKISILAFFFGFVAAKSCVNLTIPVTISSRNGVFNNYAIPETPLDSTAFSLNLTTFAKNATAEALTGYATVSGTYQISAQLCTPTTKGSHNTVQVLTHGLGFDKTYWDPAYDNFKYSYVDTALSYGYSVFYYDRLGVGKSSHGDPRNEIQSFLELEALAELTRKLRNGSIPGCSTTFSKVVHVGHSFGSFQAYALAAKYPSLADGIILTGWSLNSSFVSIWAAGGNFVTASTNQPYRLGSATDSGAISKIINAKANLDPSLVETYGLTDYFVLPEPGTQPLNYPNGYFVNRDVNALVYQFLHPGYFDPGIAYFAEAGKQPVTMGELLSIASVPFPSFFPGPVLVFTGSNDVPFCGGNCYVGGLAPDIPAQAKPVFPNASIFESYIQPNTGHGLTLHYNATAGYTYINDWLKGKGLAA